MMKNSKLLVILFVLSVVSLSAQNSKQRDFNPNQLELRLNSGFSINKAQVLTGSEQYRKTICPDYSLSASYNRLLSEKFSISLGLEYGWRKFDYNYAVSPDAFGYYPGYLWMPFHYVKYQKYELNGIYTFPISGGFKMKAFLGGGVANYRGGGYSIDNFGAVINFGYHSVAPFISAGIGIVKPLKNQNELSFRIKYLYSLKNIVRGDYSFPDIESTGLLLSTGNNIGLSLGYTLTGNKKNSRLNELLLQHDYKKAKKELRKELNYINPQAMFFCIYGGNGSSISKVDDPAGYLINGHDSDVFAGVSIEKGIKNNFFVGIDYHFMKHNDVLAIKDFVVNYSHDAFKAHVFSLGCGYRLILKEKYRVLDFHAGVFSGFTRTKKGSTSTESYPRAITINDDLYSYQIDKINTIDSQVLAGVYVGASKDLRIVDNLYFSMSYRFQYGLNPIYISTIEYSSNQFTGTRTVSSKQDGTSHLFQIGVKLKLG